jgi:hypothetical protein
MGQAKRVRTMYDEMDKLGRRIGERRQDLAAAGLDIVKAEARLEELRQQAHSIGRILQCADCPREIFVPAGQNLPHGWFCRPDDLKDVCARCAAREGLNRLIASGWTKLGS